MKSIYFLLLAAVIGTELTLGILVAPVIFFPQSIIGEGGAYAFYERTDDDADIFKI